MWKSTVPFQNLKFIDVLQFLNALLDTLVSDRAKEGLHKFPTEAKHFPDPLHQSFLLRKGVFPYDFLTSKDFFQQTHLPIKEQFYNKLNDNNVSSEDFEHAQKLWQTFNMNKFGEYHALYSKTDVLLFADVFENLRSLCLESYQLIRPSPSLYVPWTGMGCHVKNDRCSTTVTGRH
jgi:hypothetical protein